MTLVPLVKLGVVLRIGFAFAHIAVGYGFYGGAFNDSITGSNLVNVVYGNEGDDHLRPMDGDDTVYGGDFLQHQPPVKEMCYWGPRIIDLMDRLGVPFNRTPEGFRRSVAYLNRCLALDSTFAPAWATLAVTHGVAIFFQIIPADSARAAIGPIAGSASPIDSSISARSASSSSASSPSSHPRKPRPRSIR